MQQFTAQIFDIGNALIDFFVETDWTSVAAPLKVASALLSLLLFSTIIWVLFKYREIASLAYKSRSPQKKTSLDTEMKSFYTDTWKEICGLWVSEDVPKKRLALIEADALFDNTLRERGIPGQTMAERLQSAEMPAISNLDDIVFSHQLRNELVHETSATFDVIDGERAFKAYEQALRELGAV